MSTLVGKTGKMGGMVWCGFGTVSKTRRRNGMRCGPGFQGYRHNMLVFPPVPGRPFDIAFFVMPCLD
ncbi:expressed unknown protein [Ectocarpus siliculosus]|uniref:Uncharacterized protein n=1 Tax=Ectocarpus siliculosus TaxID=2880 RepID=D7G3V8_ECTSI|nr:expressed unknown protein [Ectocarpus siliculosus]|eukprot:CBJ33635.1 expressed unknown protein [Ectocarpus siliculosus]